MLVVVCYNSKFLNFWRYFLSPQDRVDSTLEAYVIGGFGDTWDS